MRNFILTALLVLGLTTPAKADLFEDTKAATVMVTNVSGSSGGSGTIIRSTPSASLILTNAHVCKLLEKGGIVITTKGTEHQVRKYKVSKVHDLCVAVVSQDLGVNTYLASSAPSEGEKIVVSGHPYLYPHINMPGHITGKLNVTMMGATQNCTKKEFKEYPFICAFYGMPIINRYETRVVSSMIAGGNSGSGVYNSFGKLVGVVFAGRGRGFTAGIIVPYEYVRGFLKVEYKKLKWKKAKNSYKYSEDEPQNFKHNYKVKGLRLIDLKDKTSLVFPAVYNPAIDNLYEALRCSISKATTCLTK